MSLIVTSPSDVLAGVRNRFKRRRLALNLTQAGLADRADVTLASLRRFERTGLIAFDSLLKLALVLECLEDFEKVASDERQVLSGVSLDDVLAGKSGRQKGRLR